MSTYIKKKKKKKATLVKVTPIIHV